MDIRYKYAVGLRNHATGEMTHGTYLSRCSTIGRTVAQLEKDGHQTVTSIKKIFVKRVAGINY